MSALKSFLYGLILSQVVPSLLVIGFSAVAQAQSVPRIQFQSAFKSYRTVQFPATMKTESGPVDVAASIPTNLAPGQSANEVIVRIGDRVLQNWLSSDAVRTSALGRSKASVEEAMKTEVHLKKSDLKGMDHRFSLQLLALQALTKLEYKGWLNASLSFNARASETLVEFRDKIWANKDLFVNHKVSPNNDLSSLGVRWDW